jgi:Uma2 family endonuclease
MPAPARKYWTYEDLEATPRDGYRYEILFGELVLIGSPIPEHQRALRELALLLITHTRRHSLGEVLFAPVDVILAPGVVVQPDLLFVSANRSEKVESRAPIRFAPDLVVEILSETTAARDRGVKADVYAAAGVPHLWYLAPLTRSLQAYDLHDGRYRLVGSYESDAAFQPTLFPGLRVSMTEIWRA